MLQKLFRRLEHVDGYGEPFIRFTLGDLGASRFGLTEDEILDLISDGPVLRDFRDRNPESPDINRIPWIRWSRLLLDIEPYLSERSSHGMNVLSFYHSQFRRAVEIEFLGGEQPHSQHQDMASAQPGSTHESNSVEQLRSRHREMAAYFQKKGFLSGRAIDELVYHQTEAEDWPAVERTLTSVSFLFIKADTVGVFALLQDFGCSSANPLK